jgi:hypothetical protein
MPIGMPGWPDLAASTASIASARIALAICASEARSARGRLSAAVASGIREPAGETQRGFRRPRGAKGTEKGIENYRESDNIVQ